MRHWLVVLCVLRVLVLVPLLVQGGMLELLCLLELSVSRPGLLGIDCLGCAAVGFCRVPKLGFDLRCTCNVTPSFSLYTCHTTARHQSGLPRSRVCVLVTRDDRIVVL